MHFTVDGDGSNHFVVADDAGNLIASLHYTSWLPDKAMITVGDDLIYQLERSGFWNSGIVISKGGLEYATIETNWRGGVVISFTSGRTLLLKKKSFWGGDHVCIDESENEIADITTDFKWRTFSFFHDIYLSDNALDRESTLLLPAILTYCMKYMRMRHSAAV